MKRRPSTCQHTFFGGVELYRSNVSNSGVLYVGSLNVENGTHVLRPAGTCKNSGSM